jgi:hypothetical protein
MASIDKGINDDQRVSRRRVIKGGVLAAAGTVATLLSHNAAADAVTPLDVKRVMGRPGGGTLRPRRRIVITRMP